MKKFILDLTVSSISQPHERYVLIKLTHDRPLPDMLPGQFAEVRVDHSPATFLRRPISVCNVDRAANELWLLVALVGEGTRQLARLKKQERLNCVLPLGNGFSTNDTLYNNKAEAPKTLLVGGGVGVAPLLYLGAELKKNGGEPTFLLGARTAKDLLLTSEFEKYGNVYTTTEDGSEGEKGFVTQHSILQQQKFDKIYTCGPTPMMKAVARYADSRNTDCEASLENHMACGLGACLCCVEKVAGNDATAGKTTNVCVCKDGPVFNTKQLLWQS